MAGFEAALQAWALQAWALQAWALQAWAVQTLDSRTQQLVLDGKALRGIHNEELPGVRLVAVYAPEAGLMLAQAGGQDQRGAGGD